VTVCSLLDAFSTNYYPELIHSGSVLSPVLAVNNTFSTDYYYMLTPGIKPGYRTVLAEVVNQGSQSSGTQTTSGSRDGEASQSTQHYGDLVKGDKLDTCKACQAGRRYASRRARATQLVLGEISTNAAKPRAPRTNYRCSQCLIALCNADLCWQEHLAVYLGNS
jgi:hypothetical protein